MNTLLNSLLLALIPFAFNLLLDVCFGRPTDDDFDDKAIFFSFPLWLAIRRLKYFGLFDVLAEDALKVIKDPSTTPLTRYDVKRGLRRSLFEEGRKYFNYEKGIGMCPTCTGVRIAIIFGAFFALVYHYSFFLIILLPMFSNLYLLIYQKFKN